MTGLVFIFIADILMFVKHFVFKSNTINMKLFLLLDC